MPKQLDSIKDLDRTKTKSPEELTSIWDDYHLGRGHIGITMKAQLYRLLEQRAAECRYFVIPLWRGNGYITMFSQVEAPRIIFTGLEDYKARGCVTSSGLEDYKAINIRMTLSSRMCYKLWICLFSDLIKSRQKVL